VVVDSFPPPHSWCSRQLLVRCATL